MKTALVLSGGGFKGAFQAGAIRYLFEKGILPDLVVGISAGALNGSMVASGKYKELEDMWDIIAKNGASEIYDSTYAEIKPSLSLKVKEIYKYFFSDQNPLSILTKGGRARLSSKAQKFNHLTTASGLRNKLKVITLNDFKVPFLTGAVSLNDGVLHMLTNEDFSSDDQIRLFIEASATMPIIAKPIDLVLSRERSMVNLVDGGIKANVPLPQTIDYLKTKKGNWKIIAISCASDQLSPQMPTNLLNIGLRALSDITINKMSNDAYATTKMINTFVRDSGKSELSGYKEYPITVISPNGIDIGDTLDASKEMIVKRLELGYLSAKRAFEN